ncbi:hypothetical protein Tco_1256358 [Tanacetum coccineum]
MAAKEEHSTSPHSRLQSSAKGCSSSPTQMLFFPLISQRTASVQVRASFIVLLTSQGTAELQGKYKRPQDRKSKTLISSQTNSIAQDKLKAHVTGGITAEGTLYGRALCSKKTRYSIYLSLRILLIKDAAGTITPRILNFEEEAGPSSPLRQSQVMEPEEQLKAAEVLVSISRPRGLSIPGPIQTQPQQPTQGTDSKDKGKGILVEEPKKKKLTLQQIRALETTNDEEVARKIQVLHGDAEEERKRSKDTKICKNLSYLNKMKELYDKVQASIKDSFKDFIPMDSEKEREMLKERDAKRLLRKRKATISEEQPSQKP